MRRRVRDRLPARAPGAFPSFLYKSLDELKGAWGEPGTSTELVERCHALHGKPLLILSDADVELALRQRVGFPWTLQLALIRLRQDPLREGHSSGSGDMLRTALDVPRAAWGLYLAELDEIVDRIVPTLCGGDDPDLEPLVRSYRASLGER